MCNIIKNILLNLFFLNLKLKLIIKIKREDIELYSFFIFYLFFKIFFFVFVCFCRFKENYIWWLKNKIKNFMR